MFATLWYFVSFWFVCQRQNHFTGPMANLLLDHKPSAPAKVAHRTGWFCQSGFSPAYQMGTVFSTQRIKHMGQGWANVTLYLTSMLGAFLNCWAIEQQSLKTSCWPAFWPPVCEIWIQWKIEHVWTRLVFQVCQMTGAERTWPRVSQLLPWIAECRPLSAKTVWFAARCFSHQQ